MRRDHVFRETHHANHTGRCLALLLPVLYVCAGSASGRGEGIDIADRWEPCVDAYWVESTTGDIRQVLHEPVMQDAALVHDAPWEGNTSAYVTVFRDGPIYRMYYRGSHSDPDGRRTHPEYTCYAESRDGKTFTRPRLGLVEFEGSRDNNIILAGPGTHNFTPFKDTRPGCDPQARYKAVARGHDDNHKKLLAFQSPDGIHWKLMRPEPIIADGAFDSQNLAFWDPVRNHYRCYYRDFHNGLRDIKVATSEDFLHWTPGEWLSYPSAPAQHLYTNQIQPYPGAEHILLGLPSRYLPDRRSMVEGCFMTSRDGVIFDRRPEALLPPGRNPARWQNRSNYIWLGLVETAPPVPGVETEWSMYASESYYKGGAAVTRRYTLRPDGFVSWQAGWNGGEIVTKPLTFAGDPLVINFATSAAGSIRIELQNSDGSPVSGFSLADCPEIYGDKIRQTVAWNAPDGPASTLSHLAGQPIRLRFVLKDADLYAFGFRPR